MVDERSELNRTQRVPEVAMSPMRIEPGQKRVRVFLGGEVIADSTNVKLVWEKPYYPTYFIPEVDVRMELLTPTNHTKRSPSRGEVKFFSVKGGSSTAENAAYHHPDSPIAERPGHIAFVWDVMDAWFEEDEEVFVHARYPVHASSTFWRVLATSRSKWVARPWPTVTMPACCSKPGCRRGITSPRRMSEWIFSTRRRPEPIAPTRERLSTGPSRWIGISATISSGDTGRPSKKACE